MRKKKMVKKIGVNLYKPQAEIVQKIEESGDEVSEIIRGLISEYGARRFPTEPLYAQIQKERLEIKKRTVEEEEAWENLKPEEYAINTLKARVKGPYVYLMMFSGSAGWTNVVTIPLNEIKEKNAENSLWVKTHLEILDHNFTLERPGNPPMIWTYQDCENAIKMYNEQVDKA